MSGGVVCWTHSVSEAESENVSECHSHPLTRPSK